MEYIKSRRAQQIVDAIWNSKGVRKIGEFRGAVLDLALFSGRQAEVSIFVKGWEAAGGGDLFKTHMRIGSGVGAVHGVILWKDDPVEMLEKMVADMRPEILVMLVQEM